MEPAAVAARQSRFDGDRASSSARFEQLSKEREARRRAFSSRPHGAALQGTCQEMCPEYERYERDVHMDVNAFEALPNTRTGEPLRMDHGKAVKKYHRPAAGNEAPLPEDVRPGPVLRKTVLYLAKLLDSVSSEPSSFAPAHAFVRDRSRSLRQDATLQNLRVDADSLAVHQAIARFHILSGHRLCELGAAEFDAFQNTEQLRKVLQSLSEFYTDIRAVAGLGLLKDEGEFRAYYLLTHLEDPDVYRKCFRWPREVLQAPAVQLALAAGAAFHQHDYISYFRLLHAQPAMPKRVFYLCACLMHANFPALRLAAAGGIAKAYAPGSSIPAGKLASWLALEDEAELLEWCRATGFDPKIGVNGQVFEVAKPASATSSTMKARVSQRIIEAMAIGLSVSEMILQEEDLTISPVSTIPFQPPIVPPVPIAAPPAPAIASAPAVPFSFKPPNAVVVPPTPVQPIASPPPVPSFNAPKEPPVKQLEPKPITLVAKDTLPLAKAVLKDLLDAVCSAKVQAAASEVCARQEQVFLATRYILRSLVHQLVCEIATEVVQVQRVLLEELLLEGLVQRSVQTMVQEAAEEAYREELRTRLREQETAADPLEHAYEAGIKMARPLKPTRPVTRTVKMARPAKTKPDVPPQRAPALDTEKLRAAIEEEKRESARLEARIQALLQDGL